MADPGGEGCTQVVARAPGTSPRPRPVTEGPIAIHVPESLHQGGFRQGHCLAMDSRVAAPGRARSARSWSLRHNAAAASLAAFMQGGKCVVRQGLARDAAG